MRSTCTSLWLRAGGRLRSAVPPLAYAGVCGALGGAAWAGLAAVAAALAGRPTMAGLVLRLVVTATAVVVTGVLADPILDRVRRGWLAWRAIRRARRLGATAVPADRSVRP